MSNKPKMTKDTIPEDFTLSLALVDTLPVLFFGASMILIGLLFGSPLFLIGTALCFWAGAAKVIWKIIVVTKKKNVWWMFLQMRIVMPIGFVLMIIAVILNRSAIDLSNVFAAIVSLPSVIFFTIGVIGMVLPQNIYMPMGGKQAIQDRLTHTDGIKPQSEISLIIADTPDVPLTAKAVLSVTRFTKALNTTNPSGRSFRIHRKRSSTRKLSRPFTN